MKHPAYCRSGRTLLALVALLCLVLAVVAFFVFFRESGGAASDQTVLLHTVERGDFEAFVTEPGDVASSSNVEIRCRVKSPGAAGTPILKIALEGTQVKKDDFVLQFDDSLLKNEALQQQIVVANNKALLTQAESDLANAIQTLREFDKGLFQQELETLEGEVFVAEEALRNAELTLASSRRLCARGLITELQLKASEYALEKAKKDLAAARRKTEVYKGFTREKMMAEYQAEIKKQEANVEAATYTLELSKQKLAELEEQIENCLIKAPADGQVVYANDRSRGDDVDVIEEGTLIRENQVVIRLPDIRKMQVDVKINESHVNRINPGQQAEILLDADPNTVLRGEVKEVAPYPFPIRWHGSPMEFGTVVSIIDPPPTIRPGLRAKVKIVFESQRDVLQVPLAAVIEHGNCHYCLVRDGTKWSPQQVTIGSNNNNQVVVLDGLAEGKQVSLTPFRHIERADLPAASAAEVASDKSNQDTINPAAFTNTPAAAPAS